MKLTRAFEDLFYMSNNLTFWKYFVKIVIHFIFTTKSKPKFKINFDFHRKQLLRNKTLRYERFSSSDENICL